MAKRPELRIVRASGGRVALPRSILSFARQGLLRALPDVPEQAIEAEIENSFALEDDPAVDAIVDWLERRRAKREGQ